MDEKSPGAARFCARHGIAAISLSPMTGVTAAEPVCEVLIEFNAEGKSSAYRVQFKLQAAQAQFGARFRRIEADGRIDGVVGSTGSPVEPLDSFLRCIEPRIAKIRHEQSVQNIPFVGNRFEMAGRTVFTVLSEQDGKLAIELHRGSTRQPAVLLASSLLDGLYDGSIRPQ